MFYCLIILFSILNFSLNYDSQIDSSEQNTEEGNNRTIYINISEKQKNIYIGKKGYFYIQTDFYDCENIFDSSDIEKIYFTYAAEDMPGCGYDFTCRLWKPMNDSLKILCKNKCYSKIYGFLYFVK